MSDSYLLNRLLDDLEDEGKLGEPDELLAAFAQWADDSGRPLYPHQEEAALAIMSGQHVIVATPTGSGKSLIAIAAHLVSLARGGRTYYTAPLKALVNEKFFDLVSLFGPSNVGMITGDVQLNADAPIIACTAEILANEALRHGANTDADTVVMDEFHFYGDHQRGWAWQVPLLELKKTQFILMSATLGDVSFLSSDLLRRTGVEVSVIADAPRPVPLEMEYHIAPGHEVIADLVEKGQTPAYLVNFSQREAIEMARALTSGGPYISKTARTNLKAAIGDFRFGAGFGKTLSNLLKHGIGVHHAGMLPRYRRLVERLAQDGLLAVVCGTDTLGVGINVPIRSVVFTALTKFDGNKVRHLSAREFHQIAGRAGRAGFDTIGYVKVLGSEAEVARLRNQVRAGEGKRKKATPKAKTGEISWTKQTFERLREAKPEALTSRFAVNHAMVLQVLARGENAGTDLLRLCLDNHDRPGERNAHLRRLGDVFRSLKTAELIEYGTPEDGGKAHWRLRAQVPDDFALNQPLSPFALAALELLDRDSADYALDVVSIIEAVVEDPRPLLIAQLKAAKGEAIAAFKAQGLDYEQRMEALEDVTWPMPLSDLLTGAFGTYRRANPWVESHEISPKSVVREMVETAMTFSDLIARYDVARSEGVILRYLTDVYRALAQIVPPEALSEGVQEIIDWLATMVRAVDSSLIDEWESLENGGSPRTETTDSGGSQVPFGADANGIVPFSKNPHLLRASTRKTSFHLVELLSRDDVTALARAGFIDLDGKLWDEDRWDAVLATFWEEHDLIRIDQEARSGSWSLIGTDFAGLGATGADFAGLGATGADFAGRPEAQNYVPVTQILLDGDGDHDWRIYAALDLAASDEAGCAILRIVEVSSQIY